MTEFEVRILEIDEKDMIQQLEKLNAKKVGTYYQKRVVFDFNPIQKNKWIRLRSNGEETTLTIKEVKDKNRLDGTEELEITVSDFDIAYKIIQEMGYKKRAYQENKRTLYRFGEIEFCIDAWPLIPTYMEIEGKSKESVENILTKLNFPKDKLTTLDVSSVYETFYKIDVNEIPELILEENR